MLKLRHKLSGLGILTVVCAGVFLGLFPAYGDFPYNLAVPIGGTSVVTSLTDYILTIYEFAIGIIGVIAALMIVWGGFRWVTAAGNDTHIGEAKATITMAIIGLVIGLGSYLILYTINPELIELKDINPPEITPISECADSELHQKAAGQACTKNCECQEVFKDKDKASQYAACVDSTCRLVVNQECAWKKITKNTGVTAAGAEGNGSSACPQNYHCVMEENGVDPVTADNNDAALDYYYLSWVCKDSGECNVIQLNAGVHTDATTLVCCYPNILYNEECYTSTKEFVTQADKKYDK